MGTPRSVLIVEDHAVIAEALAASLSANGFEPVDVVGHRHLTPEGVVAAVDERSPDLVLLDLHLGDGVEGLPLIGPITERGATVVVLTASTELWKHGEAFEAGAFDVVAKSDLFRELMEAVDATGSPSSGVSARRRADALTALRRHREQNAQRYEPFTRLTASEQMVLRQLIAGASVERIAITRGVGHETVRTQVKSILRKLGVHSQLAAVSAAREAGWPE